MLRLIDEILTEEGDQRAANLNEALEFLNKVTRRKVVTFLISDFLTPEPFSHALNVSSRRHDLIPLVLTDPAEEELAKVGLLSVEDAASGELSFYDVSGRGASAYRQAQAARDEELQTLFKRAGVAHIRVRTDDSDYAAPLVNYFKIRARRG